MGRAHLAGADLVRSRRDARDHHAVPGHVRDPRRDGQVDAGQRHRPEPGRVVADVARRAHLRLHAAQGREVPQRRRAHLRGREVLVRSLPRGRRQGAEGPRRRGGDARALPGALPAEEPVARLHDLLHRGQRSRLDRPEEIRREGRRRRLQEGPGGRRTVQVRLLHAGHRARPGSERLLLAQDAEREAARLQGDHRRDDPAGRAEARRDRRGLLDPRRAGRGAGAHARPHAEARGHPVAAVGRDARPVGSEIALARSARPPGGQPGDRPQGHQPGDHARPLAADLQHHPQHVRLLLAAAGLSVRPGAGQEAPGRGGLPERLRRRRLLPGHLVRERPGGHRQRFPAGRHPHQADLARAGVALVHLHRQEVQEPRVHGERRVRQRGDAARGLRRRPAAPTSTAATRTSTRSSRTRPPSWIARSARRSCTGSSSS